jgi:hypothetical protein
MAEVHIAECKHGIFYHVHTEIPRGYHASIHDECPDFCIYHKGGVVPNGKHRRNS